MTTDRTTIRLDDERKRLFDRASGIVARDELDPRTIQRFNTDVLALKYRTSIDERWR